MIHWLKSLFKRKQKPRFEDLKFDTPEQLSEWMYANLAYRPEIAELNYWQTPKETFENRAGDCEDYALFSQYFFGGNLIGIYSDSEAHCINLMPDYRVMDLWKLKNFNGFSIEGICDVLMPDWTSYGFLRRGKNGEVIISRKITRQ